MSKETFIIRTEWAEAIMDLNPPRQATIFRNLFHYHRGELSSIDLSDSSVKLVWKLIEPNLKRNIENYDRRKETSAINGKRGGRPRKEGIENLNNLNKPNDKPNESGKPNESLSVSVSDSVSVSVNDYVVSPAPPELPPPPAPPILPIDPDNTFLSVDVLAVAALSDTVHYMPSVYKRLSNSGYALQEMKTIRERMPDLMAEFVEHLKGEQKHSNSPPGFRSHFKNWLCKKPPAELTGAFIPKHSNNVNQPSHIPIIDKAALAAKYR